VYGGLFVPVRFPTETTIAVGRPLRASEKKYKKDFQVHHKKEKNKEIISATKLTIQ
jgi:hypothetical protein